MTETVDIILATANARYVHASMGLRCLYANLGPLRGQARIFEFDIHQEPIEIAHAILSTRPKIVGLGVYIWNVNLLTRVALILKALHPSVWLVAGGPEAGYEYENTELFKTIDYLVCGEGEEAFYGLASSLLTGIQPLSKVIPAAPVHLERIIPPYADYTDEDIRNRLLYVESSRGCPFRCSFCLSANSHPVREVPSELFFKSMENLLERGARRFKFTDRTFNLDPERTTAILRFFIERWREGMQLHFEILPDRLSTSMLEWIARFPAEGLHLELGVQTFHPPTQDAIDRPQDLDATIRNLRFLRQQTGALLHVDLVAGLPEETWESFANGFDQLIAIEPHAIQVGILKRLKGSPLARHPTPSGTSFAPFPPYEVLETTYIDFEHMQRIKRFARYFELYYNAARFRLALPLLWRTDKCPFTAFMALTDAIWSATGRTHKLSLARQSELLHHFLTAHGITPLEAASAIEADFRSRPGRHDVLDLE